MSTRDVGTSVTAHIAGLRRYAKALVGDPSDADDLVQECLTRALSRAELFAKARNPRAYLFSILHNLYVDQISAARRRGDDVPLERVETVMSRPPTQMHAMELIDLEAALQKLPVEQRQVLLLVGLEGLRYAETAAVVGVPIGTVMSRLFRGREALRRLMAGESVIELRQIK